MLQCGAETVDSGFDLNFAEAKATLLLWQGKDNGILETPGCNSTEIKLSTISDTPEGVSGNSYSSGIPTTPLPQQLVGTRSSVKL